MSRRVLEPVRAVSFSRNRVLLRPSIPIPRLFDRPRRMRQLPAPFHTTSSQWRSRQTPPKEPPKTDFGDLDVLADTPTPPTAVDRCLAKGFHLNGGAKVTDGSGVLLVNGEAFTWRPWLAMAEKRFINKKGQVELPKEAFGVLDVVWPRPGRWLQEPPPMMPRTQPLSTNYSRNTNCWSWTSNTTP